MTVAYCPYCGGEVGSLLDECRKPECAWRFIAWEAAEAFRTEAVHDDEPTEPTELGDRT